MRKEWIRAAAIRAIKTMAQTAIGSIGAAALISEVDWLVVLSSSVLAGILSILSSIAGLPEVKEKDAPTQNILIKYGDGSDMDKFLKGRNNNG